MLSFKKIGQPYYIRVAVTVNHHYLEISMTAIIKFVSTEYAYGATQLNRSYKTHFILTHYKTR